MGRFRFPDLTAAVPPRWFSMPIKFIYFYLHLPPSSRPRLVQLRNDHVYALSQRACYVIHFYFHFQSKFSNWPSRSRSDARNFKSPLNFMNLFRKDRNGSIENSLPTHLHIRFPSNLSLPFRGFVFIFASSFVRYGTVFAAKLSTPGSEASVYPWPYCM